MGSSLSQEINESIERGGEDFIIEGTKIKVKEAGTALESIKEKLPDLKSFEVRDCKLKHIPKQIQLFSNQPLYSINLGNNKLSTLDHRSQKSI